MQFKSELNVCVCCSAILSLFLLNSDLYLILKIQVHIISERPVSSKKTNVPNFVVVVIVFFFLREIFIT